MGHKLQRPLNHGAFKCTSRTIAHLCIQVGSSDNDCFRLHIGGHLGHSFTDKQTQVSPEGGVLGHVR